MNTGQEVTQVQYYLNNGTKLYVLTATVLEGDGILNEFEETIQTFKFE